MSDQEPAEGHIARALSKRTLLAILGGGLVLATAIAVLFVLPVEFHFDPTGFGKASGLAKLAGPKEVAVSAAPAAAGGGAPRFYDTPYRSDVIDIPLASAESDGVYELEYKVAMKAGAAITYSWTAPGVANPEEFYYDFHGESPPTPEVKIAEYRQATGTASSGVLIAPFDGVHGWYLQNQSIKPVIVKLRISGFYTLVAPGDKGNEAGIVAPGQSAKPPAG